MTTCENCDGKGGWEGWEGDPVSGWRELECWHECPACDGFGWVPGDLEELTMDDLPPPRSGL